VDRYEDAAEAFMRLVPQWDVEKDAGDLLLLAESLLRSNRPEEALPYFEQLVAVEETADQALYRSGQILQKQGREEQALNLFRRLVDEGNSEQWQKMAREMLELMSLSL
jgi:tetratricopeptide (TPR) repeat protein